MRSIYLCLALSVGALVAEEPKGVEEWVDTLAANYSKLSGHLVTYRSLGENKELNATIGVDQASGRSAMVVKADGPEGAFEFRFWNTEEGDLLIDDNGNRTRCLSLEKTFEFLLGLANLMPSGVSSALEQSPIPMLLLTRDSVEVVVRVGNSKTPHWALLAADELELKEVTPERVVFTTTTYGELSIDRANGILARQELQGVAGEARILERIEFHEISEAAKVAAVSRGWSELGATNGGLTEGTMASILAFFQQIIGCVEEGQIGLEALEGKMTEHDEVRRFAGQVLLRNKRPVQSPISWEKVLGIARAEIKKQWTAELPEGEPADEEAFTVYLTEPNKRVLVRDELAAAMSSVDGMLPLVMTEIWGPGAGEGLKADSASAREAKKIIETALCQAYLGAMLHEKMAESWGERKGLD
jgi:hypothetical protein